MALFLTSKDASSIYLKPQNVYFKAYHKSEYV